MTNINELQTPALLVDHAVFDSNLQLMAQAHPGRRLRPHVKAHKTTELARSRGLEVRGVMGYEGHAMVIADPDERRKVVEECMGKLLAAHADVGGDIVSAGGTGTYAVNTWANEIQAGSYALMDTAYAALPDLPFGHALTVLGAVISTTAPSAGIPGWTVVDVGLKSLGMD